MEIEYIIYLALLFVFILVFSVFLYANLPIQWTIRGKFPTVSYLADTTLQEICSEEKPFVGEEVQVTYF